MGNLCTEANTIDSISRKEHGDKEANEDNHMEKWKLRQIEGDRLKLNETILARWGYHDREIKIKYEESRCG